MNHWYRLYDNAVQITDELESHGIPVMEGDPSTIQTVETGEEWRREKGALGELVPVNIYGKLGNFCFIRTCSGWVVNGPVPLPVAEKLYAMKDLRKSICVGCNPLGPPPAHAYVHIVVRSEQLYQSIVPLEGDTLSDTFASYLSQSEQMQAFLLLLADGEAACGLLLEKLPKADERDPDGWNRMTRFAATLTLAETLDTQPYDLLTRLFPEELLRVYKLRAVEYHCPYDVEKVKDMLRSLGRPEVESILA